RPGFRAWWFGLALWALIDSEIQTFWGGLAQQAQEGLQSGTVGIGGIELDSGGKQRCLIKALKAFSLAFSRSSCSISFSICSLSFLTCKISFSICFVLSLLCSVSSLSFCSRCS
ncbi:MAG: hypothetical protein ACKOPS_08710, partial [Cyanobium sp.]